MGYSRGVSLVMSAVENLGAQSGFFGPDIPQMPQEEVYPSVSSCVQDVIEMYTTCIPSIWPQ